MSESERERERERERVTCVFITLFSQTLIYCIESEMQHYHFRNRIIGICFSIQLHSCFSTD